MTKLAVVNIILIVAIGVMNGTEKPKLIISKKLPILIHVQPAPESSTELSTQAGPAGAATAHNDIPSTTGDILAASEKVIMAWSEEKPGQQEMRKADIKIDVSRYSVDVGKVQQNIKVVIVFGFFVGESNLCILMSEGTNHYDISLGVEMATNSGTFSKTITGVYNKSTIIELTSQQTALEKPSLLQRLSPRTLRKTRPPPQSDVQVLVRLYSKGRFPMELLLCKTTSGRLEKLSQTAKIEFFTNRK